jgi:hypothetical protein
VSLLYIYYLGANGDDHMKETSLYIEVYFPIDICLMKLLCRYPIKSTISEILISISQTKVFLEGGKYFFLRL